MLGSHANALSLGMKLILIFTSILMLAPLIRADEVVSHDRTVVVEHHHRHHMHHEVVVVQHN
jgi:hypothetical protein